VNGRPLECGTANVGADGKGVFFRDERADGVLERAQLFERLTQVHEIDHRDKQNRKKNYGA
jgi:hypothetical protein